MRSACPSAMSAVKNATPDSCREEEPVITARIYLCSSPFCIKIVGLITVVLSPADLSASSPAQCSEGKRPGGGSLSESRARDAHLHDVVNLCALERRHGALVPRGHLI